jgi:large subunit ribosomal protein L6e
MSAATEAQSQHQPQTKKFGKQERTVPHKSQKASKWYPAEDQKQPKKVSLLSEKWRAEEQAVVGTFPTSTICI